MATEVILMQCVKAGGDRQILHESIREHSMAAGRRVQHGILFLPVYFIPSFTSYFFDYLFSFLLSFLPSHLRPFVLSFLPLFSSPFLFSFAL